MDEPLETNRRVWDELAALHPGTEFYDVPGFLDGDSSLNPLELDEVGDIVCDADSLLHLQCHFGMDTLSWARDCDVDVVGVDFSPEAIEQTRSLASAAGLGDRATFVEANVLEFDLDRTFDVVFTSYGVINWLPDLDAWAATIDTHLRPGGTFYIAEFHPFAWMFEDISKQDGRLAYPYFDQDEPITIDEDGSYADPDASLEHTRTNEWSHSLGTIITSLCDVGLQIEFLHEYPWLEFQLYPSMVEDDDGYWRLPDDGTPDVPLTFSIRAKKG